MKKSSILISVIVISLFALVGCQPTPTPTPTPMPNLVVQNATIDFAAKTVSITEENNGNADAGEHLTYIEINLVDAADALKPQCQYSLNVPSIAAGSTWSSDLIPFTDFSCPVERGGGDLSILTTANLVVTADAKGMVEESNESDNIFDNNQ
jgi:hypothetical protein